MWYWGFNGRVSLYFSNICVLCNTTGSLRSPTSFSLSLNPVGPSLCVCFCPLTLTMYPFPCLFGSSRTETGHKISWKELQATESGAFFHSRGDLPYAQSHVRPQRKSSLSLLERPSSQRELCGVVNSAEETGTRGWRLTKDALVGIKVAQMTSWNVERNDAPVSCKSRADIGILLEKKKKAPKPDRNQVICMCTKRVIPSVSV